MKEKDVVIHFWTGIDIKKIECQAFAQLNNNKFIIGCGWRGMNFEFGDIETITGKYEVVDSITNYWRYIGPESDFLGTIDWGTIEIHSVENIQEFPYCEFDIVLPKFIGHHKGGRA